MKYLIEMIETLLHLPVEEKKWSEVNKGNVKKLRLRFLITGVLLKSLARPTSRCILFDGSLVIYINSTNIPPIMIINRIYEYQILLRL